MTNEVHVIEVWYVDGEKDTFPFKIRSSAETFMKRLRKRKDIASATLLPPASKH